MKELRDYQIEGKQDIYKAWNKSSCVFFVLATGGGKTVTFVEVIRDFIYRGEDALLLAHREELIYQAHATLFGNKIMSGIIKTKEPYLADMRCQVGSVQTMARRDLSKFKAPGLIVIDEGHHVTEDNTYGRILAQWPFAKVLIVSATPYRLSGEGFLNIMPNNETQLVMNRTLAQLIKEAYLVPIRYFLGEVPDLTQVATRGGEYDEEQVRKIVKLGPIIDNYLEHAAGKSFLCFAINVQHSKDIASAFWNRGIPVAHLDADTPPEERKETIKLFKLGFIRGIINCGILTEGTDFPMCECIILARPTKSLSLFLQMVGRGTRCVDGLLEGLGRAEDLEKRMIAIAASSKPECIVLDSASCFMDHGMPDTDINWERHFRGTKGEKRKKTDIEEEIEIEVFLFEDEKGNIRKTLNIKEIEGMRLVEVTREMRRKIINIKSIKQFEAGYAKAKVFPGIKKPGYHAYLQYKEYCKKENILMIPQIWDYLEQKLVKNPKLQKDVIYTNQKNFPGAYTPGMIDKAVKKIDNERVSEQYLQKERQQYARENADQLAQYMASQLVNNS